ncbi:MAG: TonB-dependent receptor [Bacteroides sp.]|uniref:TonB-dependent receptor n=2 Tax=Bacteroides sp. TaxID=29523 RepID=UPI002FC8099A
MKNKLLREKILSSLNINSFKRMKLIVLFIALSVWQLSASESYAQNAKISLNLKNATLKEVIQSIEKQTEFVFFYSNEEIDINKKVDINKRNSDIAEVLNTILSNYSYRIENRKILLMPKAIQQSSSKIKGVVKDAAGETIIGANVMVKGTSNGTITDMNGDFTLNASPNDILVVTYIGYQQQEVPLKGKTSVNIVMQEDARALDEVVVVGYSTQKKESLTGAIATIKNEDLTRVPVASATQSLIGKLPGLITKETTGKPGETPKINIRGYGDALVIVDGVEQDNFHNIDPNEIESFTILKDASAAIYGSRAGNGVILITTRRGGQGKAKVSFGASLTGQTPNIMPQFVDSWDWAIIQNEAQAWAGKQPMFTEEEIQKFRDGSDLNFSNTDHYSELIKKWSFMKNTNLNVSGGTDKMNYFLSLGYMDQDGIYKSGDVNLKRYNVRSNVDVRISDNFFVALDLSMRITDNEDVPYSSREIFQAIGTTTNRYPGHYPDDTKIPFVNRGAVTPYLQTNRDFSGYNDTNREYLVGALTLKYDIPHVKGLNLKVKGNYISDQKKNKKWTKPFSTYNYDVINDIYTIAATGGKYSLTERADKSRELTLQGFVEYQNKFKDHEVQGMFVTELIDEKANWFNGYKDGFISDAIDEMFAGSSDNMSTDGTATEEARMSFIGRGYYSYKSKYMVEASARYDGSSRFAKEHRWSLFPSILLSWRLSEESFIKDQSKVIDNLKLRLSYAHSGYDKNAAAYQYLSSFKFDSQYVFGNNVYKGLKSNGLANYGISWEDIYTYNAGLDLGLWNGLLGMELDVFYRLRTNVLGDRATVLPNTFGAVLPKENLNKMDNRGFELVLKHQNTIGDLRYTISPNISFSKEKIVSFAQQEYTDPDEERLNKNRVGQWTDVVFGYRTDGFFQSEEEIKNSLIDYDLTGNKSIKPGMVKYKDLNNDKKIDWRDQEEIGNGSLPKIVYGLNISAQYKGFDFSMLMQGAAKFDIIFNDNMRSLTINNVWNSYKFLYEDRWTPDNPNASFPATTNGTNAYNTKQSDLWIRPADYLRLKNLTFGYTIPAHLTAKAGFDRVRLYLSGYNLLTFDKIRKYQQDPESGASLEYPLYKSLSFGFNIEF